jgi:tetratricopeptide (TPR) repeat protein
MPKKRLNTKFLILMGLTLSVVGLTIAVLVVMPNFVRRWFVDPQKYLVQAENEVKEGKFEDALKSMREAAKLRPADPPLMVRYGDIAAMMISTQDDPRAIELIRRSYADALEIDPVYQPALEKLLNYYSDLVAITAPADSLNVLQQLRNISERLMKVNPEDVNAKIEHARSYILAAFNGVEVDGPQVDEAIESLNAIREQDPVNADAFALLQRAHTIRAVNANNNRNQPALEAAIKEIEALLESAREHAGKSGPLSYRVAQLTADLNSFRPSEREEQLKRVAEYVALLEQAARLTAPTDEMFAEVVMSLALVKRQQGKSEEAEQVVRAGIEAQPNDQGFRNLLARVLTSNPSRRQEAIELLEKPPVINPTFVGVRGLRFREHKLERSVLRGNLRMDTITGVTDAAGKEAVLKLVDEDIAEVLKLAPNIQAPEFLRLQGRVQMARGNLIAGVQTLRRGYEAYGTNRSIATMYERTTLGLELAQAYVQTGQTAAAKRVLAEMTQELPDYVPPRYMLVNLLLAENNAREARVHVEHLEKLLPPSDWLSRVRLATYDRERDKDKIAEAFAKIPEESREQRLQKALTAAQTELFEEAIRLLEKNLANDSGDLDSAILIARVLGRMDQRERAVRFIDAAMTKHPENDQLKALKVMLSQATQAEMRALMDEVIRGIEDPVDRALARFEAARRDNDEAAQKQAIDEANAAKPDDPRVLEISLQYHLMKRDWASAEASIAKLSQLDHDKVGGRLYRIRLLQTRGDVLAALELAGEITRNYPEFSQSWTALAQVQQAAGRIEDAANNYRQALERQSQNVEAIRGMIACMAQLNRPDELKRYIDMGRRIAPGDATFLENELNWEVVYGDPRKAITSREQAVRNRPDNPQNWISLGLAYATAARSRTSAPDEASARSFLTKARDTFAEAAKQFPENPSIISGYADISLLLGESQAAEQAILAYSRLEKNRDNASIPLFVSEFYTRANRPQAAERVLRDAIAVKPMVDHQIRLARMLILQGRTDDALEVLKANESDPQIVRQRIEIYVDTRRVDLAEAAINQRLVERPDDTDLQSLLALVRQQQGRIDEAISILDKVIEREPRNAFALFYRGSIMMRRPLPDLNGAIRDLVAVRDLVPSNVESRRQLATAYRMRGDMDEAARTIESAIRITPNDKQLRFVLIDLYTESTPPRWQQIERLLDETRGMPLFANDADVDHAEAAMWVNRGEYPRALIAVQSAIRKNPQNLVYVRTLMEVLLRAKNYAGLIEIVNRAEQEANDVLWAIPYRALARIRSGDVTGGMADFEMVLDKAAAAGDTGAVSQVVATVRAEVGFDATRKLIEPRAEREVRWRLMAAYLARDARDRDAAVKWVESLIASGDQLDPRMRDLSIRAAADIYITMKPLDPVRALDLYKQILPRQAEDWTLLNNLAFVHTIRGPTFDPQQAIEYSRKANDLMRRSGANEPFVIDTYGWALVNAGRVDEGLVFIRQSLELRDYPEARYHLGEALLLKNQAKDAEAELLRAKELLDKILQVGGNVTDDELKVKVEDALQRAKEAQRG